MLCCALAAPARAQAPKWDTYPDIWVAGDGLGRSLPNAAEAGPPRANKTVGIFYFLTFAHEQDEVYDNSKILKAHPEAVRDVHHPAWGPLNAAHYWGEPLFGYYASDDEWVLRKHAQMLSNAGVDVVIFDNSNAVTYDKARETLCRVWEQIRRGRRQDAADRFPLPLQQWQRDRNVDAERTLRAALCAGTLLGPVVSLAREAADHRRSELRRSGGASAPAAAPLL